MSKNKIIEQIENDQLKSDLPAPTHAAGLKIGQFQLGPKPSKPAKSQLDPSRFDPKMIKIEFP